MMICKRCNHIIEPNSDYEVENQQHFLQDCFEYVVVDRERFRDASNNNLAGWENERNHLIVKVADRERDIDALKDQVTECEMKLAASEDPVDPDTIHVEHPIHSVHEACEAKLAESMQKIERLEMKLTGTEKAHDEAEAKLAEADQRLQHATADLAVVRRTADAYSARVATLEKALASCTTLAVAAEAVLRRMEAVQSSANQVTVSAWCSALRAALAAGKERP